MLVAKVRHDLKSGIYQLGMIKSEVGQIGLIEIRSVTNRTRLESEVGQKDKIETHLAFPALNVTCVVCEIEPAWCIFCQKKNNIKSM